MFEAVLFSTFILYNASTSSGSPQDTCKLHCQGFRFIRITETECKHGPLLINKYIQKNSINERYLFVTKKK